MKQKNKKTEKTNKKEKKRKRERKRPDAGNRRIAQTLAAESHKRRRKNYRIGFKSKAFGESDDLTTTWCWELYTNGTEICINKRIETTIRLEHGHVATRFLIPRYTYSAMKLFQTRRRWRTRRRTRHSSSRIACHAYSRHRNPKGWIDARCPQQLTVL